MGAPQSRLVVLGRRARLPPAVGRVAEAGSPPIPAALTIQTLAGVGSKAIHNRDGISGGCGIFPVTYPPCPYPSRAGQGVNLLKIETRPIE